MRRMSLQSTPLRLNLKKDEKLEIEWQDGLRSTYPIALLRRMCPCALCKTQREEELSRPKTLLRVLSGNHSRPLAVVSAELVGGYALRIEWTDDHGSGIYSFQYLREISPER
jgi:DUF971 family protein